MSEPTPKARTPEAPPALRRRSRAWRDPRLVVGVVLVCASVLAGSRLLASADDTVAVWAVGHDLQPGQTIGSGDLTPTRVRLDDVTAGRYLDASRPPPLGLVLVRPALAGELLPRAATHRGPVRPLEQVPLSVDPDDLPATVRAGSVVDVWVAPKDSTDTASTARLVLSGVVVVAMPSGGSSFAPATSRQVIVGLPADRAERLPRALGALATGRVVVVLRG